MLTTNKIKKVNINLGLSCNLNCMLCFEHRPPVPYNFDDSFAGWKENIERIKPTMVTIGENRKSDPMSEPHIDELLGYLDGIASIKKITLITNGMYPLPDEFQRLKKLQVGISIDGPREVHDWNRGPGAFDIAWAAFVKSAAIRNTWVRTIATKKLMEADVMGFIEAVEGKGGHVMIQDFIESKEGEKKDQYVFNGPFRDKGAWLESNHFTTARKCLDPDGDLTCYEKMLRGPCLYCGGYSSYSSSSSSRSSSSSSSPSSSSSGCMVIFGAIIAIIAYLFL